MEKACSHAKSDMVVHGDTRFDSQCRLSLQPRCGQLEDSCSNVVHRTFFAPSRIRFVFLFSVVSLAFRPFSLFYLVDSSCIYNLYIIIVLAVHWHKQGIETWF